MWRPYLGAALLWAIYVIAIPVGRAQEISSANQIPIERCARLPVVRALIGKTEFRFPRRYGRHDRAQPEIVLGRRDWRYRGDLLDRNRGDQRPRGFGKRSCPLA